ncbi:MAG: radical SAM protein [SAR202 cluster bacterium]|nr:hypothetical protein [Chloroflexota bacterium]MDP6420170.1 radical SAM protein [SAR202 cluster bacterium]MDP6662570.1 radical SAM protein [SAR202 cluster bacterium]MQG68253.1 radical SAM protein [SAR202 cluster bacterium]HAL48117.1 hypothetical protein [Dehalococcoidia bacterium]|tara:strand:- start:2517 stop:3722 length:1206 start_codon:yes stop_codon:yes gene_type:complete
MLNVSRLLCGTTAPGDAIRYGDAPTRADSIPRMGSIHGKPVVVWNITRTCNLHCLHCYAEAKEQAFEGELTHEQAEVVVDDLAQYQIPVLLFSGGEPLMRFDIMDLITRAKESGLRPGLSTNGTAITPQVAAELKRAGLTYVGISIDGLKTVNDKFRGKKGAFDNALAGIRASLAEDFRLSLRFTLTRHNLADLDAIFDLVEQEGIDRVCIYHLAYAGRGNKLLPFDLSHQETRDAMDLIFRRTIDFHDRGKELEILTVDNHADAVYLHHWVKENMPDRMEEVTRLLSRNKGNSSGRGISCIDNVGDVHPDQFWRTATVGNVLERPFSEIWQDDNVELLHQLRNRKGLLKGRCSQCNFVDLCNGNLRVRAESSTGDTWAEDPACYLTEAELGIADLAAQTA